jgi:hypothetical protein
MDLQITIKEVVTIVTMVITGLLVWNDKEKSISRLEQDNKYIRIEMNEVKDRFQKQQEVNETVIRLEANIKGIEERTKLILDLLQNRPR